MRQKIATTCTTSWCRWGSRWQSACLRCCLSPFPQGQQAVLGFLFFGHTDNLVFSLLSRFFLSLLAGLSSMAMFFLIYWILPNRSIPARSVLPAAIVTGLLWEAAKHLYIAALPVLDFQKVYGPFYISVGLMMWAFLSGLILLAGAHFSATRHALRQLNALRIEAR